MKTSPKLMLPFQIARIAVNVSEADGDFSCVQASTSCGYSLPVAPAPT
jgi:hypothetical protein